MKLEAKTRLKADFAGGMQPISEPAYPPATETPNDEEQLMLLLDGTCVCAACRPNLDSQPDMMPPVALVNGDKFEDLTSPLENSDLEMEQMNDMASVVHANLDQASKKLVQKYEKSVRSLAQVVEDLRASDDGALNELADDLQAPMLTMVKKLKIMKGL